MSRDSNANAIRIAALATLEEARAKLHSWRFLQALKTASADDRSAAAQLMLDIALARQSLASAILSEIVEELEEQEADLNRATKGMERAVANLDRVKPVIDAIGKILGVVGKIVSLI